MTIFSVTGPIDPSEIGPLSMHEHLFFKAGMWLSEPDEPLPDGGRVTLETRGFHTWDAFASADNLTQDDPDVALREMEWLAAAGGRGIVDVTPEASRRPELLAEVSRRSGVPVMMGAGFYCDADHPEWTRSKGVDELAEHLISDLRDGAGDTGIRPALIGEIGTSNPITERERVVLRASGVAGVETGATVSVHLQPDGQEGLEAIEILVAEGLAPERIVLDHMDAPPVPDMGYQRAAAETGAVIEYDSFGMEFTMGSHLERGPTDVTRLALTAEMIELGFQDQLVLGCDVWTKVQLRSFGGKGYEHIVRRIAPALKRNHGVSDDALEAMLVHNPRRLLDRPDPRA